MQELAAKLGQNEKIKPIELNQVEIPQATP